MDLQLDYFEMKPVIDGVRSIGIGLVKDKPIDIIMNIAPSMQPSSAMSSARAKFC